MSSPPTLRQQITDAARLLRNGGLVAFPTETVYGLGADASNERAVQRLFGAKGRPSSNPLIVHVANVQAAARLADVDDIALRLTERFWPGPLTIVLERRPNAGIAPAATAGLSTVAMRAPAHPVARELLRQAGCPVAAPSANKSGRISPTRAEHVRAQLGDAVDMVVDGGPCAVGLESTVLDLTGTAPVILRPGGATREAIEAITGPLPDPPADLLKRSPGTQHRHYAPRARLRLDATDAAPGEAYLAFGPSDVSAAATRNLSPAGDLAEAGTNLYGMLLSLDQMGAETIAVAPIPEQGLGIAINDRLRRAARLS